MKSDYEFDYEYDESTWTVNISWTTYKDRCYGADADGNRGVQMTWMEPDDITILDQHLEDITFYVRISNPKLYKTISDYAEERAVEADNDRHAQHDEDAWKGYD